ncbi:hypothetical protein KY290_031555 [Solanum tuberosum]|uniref:Uncharacterized protein n=1 Tax=Solanum tuberosum TaxID=4113 RepID=A0ABQ7U9I7_SOLTU|nr:hypothetical protein KY285_030792 [Solanum tuberosum]KAH0743562.1 hypothetical protein KY290_031555 [Solanum tuberosum]
MYCNHYVPAAGLPIPLEDELLKKLPSNDDCYNPEDVEHHAKYLNHCMGKNAGDIFNTSQVIDGTAFVDSMAHLATIQNKMLWALGPILLTQDHDKIQIKHLCLDWLNKQPPKSVLYVSFGTSTSFSTHQIKDLAIGLELSKQMFIWNIVSRLMASEEGDMIRNRSQELSKAVRRSTEEGGVSRMELESFVAHITR